MKTVSLQRIELRNFKMISDLAIDFTNRVQINGDNGTGKTTIKDAYTWLLYGKNSENQSDFSIKTLDQNNNAIPKLDHEVSGIFNVDGKIVALKRLYREKWVTKRGNDFEELTGHETKYFIDDVPKSKGEYESFVNDMMPEDIAKVISNTEYFNEQLHWKERRAILEQMAGEVTQQDIMFDLEQSAKPTDELVKLLNEGKNLDGEKERLRHAKNKIKDELEKVPARIDEANRLKGEDKDWGQIEKDIQSTLQELEIVEKHIQDSEESVRDQKQAVAKVKDDLFEKQEKLKQLEREQLSNEDPKKEIRERLEGLRNERATISNKRSEINTEAHQSQHKIVSLKNDNARLRDDWKAEDAKQFDASSAQTCCPTCKRDYDNADQKVTELRDNFNQHKTKRLNEIKTKGDQNNAEIERLEKHIAELNASLPSLEKLNEIEKHIAELERDLSAPTKKPEPTAEMIALKEEIETTVIPTIELPDNQDLLNKKADLIYKRNELQRELHGKEQVENATKRIEELKEQQRKWSQEIAELDKVDMQIDSYKKSQSQLIEQRVNSKFELVTFKMFEQQLNGGETPACECMIDGVPYNDLNTASQINAGADVINALQKHYEIMTPVFIDRKESVNHLLEMDCQTVTLKVDEEAKELEILNL